MCLCIYNIFCFYLEKKNLHSLCDCQCDCNGGEYYFTNGCSVSTGHYHIILNVYLKADLHLV